MKKNRILTESQKKQILENKQKNIIENFSNVFNKIKRLNENEIGNELPEEDVEKILNVINQNDLDLESTDELENDCGYFKYRLTWTNFTGKKEIDGEYVYTIEITVSFYLKVTGEYRHQTLYSPAEYPESELIDFDYGKINITKESTTSQDYTEYSTNNKEILNYISQKAEDKIYELDSNGDLEVDCDPY
jgi:hypothetical protein